jgi:polyphosphate glucokinase
MRKPKRILVVDVGGTHVKILATGHKARRRFPSGRGLTPRQMVEGVKELAADWAYDVVSIGYPGPVRNGRPAREPYNIGRGWVGFDFEAAFSRPVKIINDAAMQALGSYQGGTMLFLGLGTGLGSAMVVDGTVVPLELGHLAVEKKTFEDLLGAAALEKHGRKKWQMFVGTITERLIAAFQIDDVVLGGGNVKKLTKLPKGCRAGDNANAFLGGFRLWEGTVRTPRRNPRRHQPEN